MEKLLALLSSKYIPVPLDKQAHFSVGALLSFTAYFALGYWAIVPVMVVAALKEVYDYYHPNHTADIWDWIATTLGGVCGIVIAQFI